VPTLADVARLAGVGVGTASRAISGKGYVDGETRDRVLAAATELGYRRNAAARALRERRSRAIGLLIPDLTNEFYTAAAEVLQGELDAAGLQVVVSLTGHDPAAERHAWEAMLDRQVDGVVHVPIDPDAPLPADLPVVQLNRRSFGAGAPAVLADETGGVAALTEHVLAAGHRDVLVLVGPPRVSTTRDRLAGYRSVAEAAGLPEVTGSAVRGARSRIIGAGLTAEGGYRALLDLADDLPTAVIALSSRLVMGVLRACGELDLDVPGRLSVAGLGDPEWFSIWRPAITTFAPPLREMGRRAAAEILRLVDADGPPREPEPIRMPGVLQVRGSVGPPAAG
jgi:LacI family transcriptional regulator